MQTETRASHSFRPVRRITTASPNIEERVLVAGLKLGRPESYETLVRSYGGRMLALARRLLRNEEDAQDAVQEAFLSAFRKIHGFRERCHLGTWLHRITVNAALMHIRRAACRPEVEIENLLPVFDETGHHVTPVATLPAEGERRLLRDETRRCVHACIGRLPDTYRTVLVLRDIEELDTKEVAELLGVTANAVKIRLHRARQAVAKLLAEELRETNPSLPHPTLK